MTARDPSADDVLVAMTGMRGLDDEALHRPIRDWLQEVLAPKKSPAASIDPDRQAAGDFFGALAER